MDYGPFAIEHAAPVVTTWGEVWSVWWSGGSIDRNWLLHGPLGGLHAVYWWIRWGSFMQFVSVGLIVIEVVGEKRLRNLAKKLHQLINFDKTVRICFLSIVVLYLKIASIVRDVLSRLFVFAATVLGPGPSDEVIRRSKANVVCGRLAWFKKRYQKEFKRRERNSHITQAYEWYSQIEEFRIAEYLNIAVLFVGLVVISWNNPLVGEGALITMQESHQKLSTAIVIWVLISPFVSCVVTVAGAFLFTAVDAVIEFFARVLEVPFRDTFLKALTVVLVVVGFVLTMMDV